VVVTWTLTELAELAARALADAGTGVANGRVTGVPDARMVRWYTTIGLLDRPEFGVGRVARYGPRHLWQLVAVKRLQAQGLPLAEIQLRLAGATDETLRRVAALPDDGSLHRALVEGEPVGRKSAGREPVGGRSPGREPVGGKSAGREPVVPEPVGRDSVDAAELDSVVHTPTVSSPARGDRFWTARPTAKAAGTRGKVQRGTVHTGQGRTAEHQVFGLRLGEMTLLLPVQPDSDDWEAIAAAARPLLDVLAERGLLDPTKGARS
jgi:DNA-binding transcriptional MerR regulator